MHNAFELRRSYHSVALCLTIHAIYIARPYTRSHTHTRAYTLEHAETHTHTHTYTLNVQKHTQKHQITESPYVCVNVMTQERREREHSDGKKVR